MAWIEPRRGQYRVYWNNPAGSTARRDYEPFATREDAERYLRLIKAIGDDPAEARAYLHRNDPQPSAPSVQPAPVVALRLDRLAEVWLSTKTSIYEETRATYRQHIKDHILPFFGPGFDVTAMRAAPSLVGRSNRRDSVAEWLAWMNDRPARSSSGKDLGHPLAGKTIRNVHGVLYAMLEMAVEDPDVALNRNPCGSSELPKRSQVEMHFLDQDQFAKFLALFTPYWWPLLLTLAMTGIRWGEAAGLQMKNLRLDAPVPYLYVCKALRRPKGKGWVLGRPKTEASIRSIPLNPKLVEKLREHTAGLAPNDFVFLMPGGGHLHNGNFHKRFWNYPLARAVETGTLQPGLRIHDLRHTHASWLISAGRPLRSVRDRLGHESITTTDKYSHLLPDVNTGDLKVLDQAYPLLALPPLDEGRDQLPDARTQMDAEEWALPVLAIDEDDDLAA